MTRIKLINIYGVTYCASLLYLLSPGLKRQSQIWTYSTGKPLGAFMNWDAGYVDHYQHFTSSQDNPKIRFGIK